MTNSNQDDKQKKSAGALIIIGIALVGIVSLVFVVPQLRQWVSREAEPLQAISALTGLLVIVGTYFVQPLWMIVVRPMMTGEECGDNKPNGSPNPLRIRVAEKIDRLVGSLRRYRHAIAAVALIVSFVFFATIYIVIAVSPIFIVTNPRDGATINSALLGITVSGRGAKPGEVVTLYVSDRTRDYPQEGIAKIDQNGNWSVDGVVLQEEGYEYVIWAETVVDGVAVVTANRPRVTREVSDTGYPPAVVGVVTVGVLIVVGTGVWMILKRKRR